MITGLLHPRYETRKFLSAPPEPMATYIVPSGIDLRRQFLESSNQGSTPKCVAYSMSGWMEWWNWKYEGITHQIDPDPIYKRAKELDGEPGQPGTTTSAGIQAAQDLGLMTKLAADGIKAVNVDMVQRAIHRYGPLLASFQITDKWSYARPDGWIPEGGSFVGYHQVVIVGYDATAPVPFLMIQNSWGTEHGWRGFNRMSEGLARDQLLAAVALKPKAEPETTKGQGTTDEGRTDAAERSSNVADASADCGHKTQG